MGLFSIAGFPAAADEPFVPGATTDFTRVPLHPIDDVFADIAQSNRVSSALRLRYR